MQNDLLSILSTHLDLYHPALSLDDHERIREVIALHALDHITKFVAPVSTFIVFIKKFAENGDEF